MLWSVGGVLANARAMAATLAGRGLRIVSGGTDSHLFLVDLRPMATTGKDAEAALGAAHLTVNKNAIPNDPEKPTVTSGIRVGTAALTTRGLGEAQARATADCIAAVLDARGDAARIARVAARARELRAAHPVYRRAS